MRVISIWSKVGNVWGIVGIIRWFTHNKTRRVWVWEFIEVLTYLKTASYVSLKLWEVKWVSRNYCSAHSKSVPSSCTRCYNDFLTPCGTVETFFLHYHWLGIFLFVVGYYPIRAQPAISTWLGILLVFSLQYYKGQISYTGEGAMVLWGHSVFSWWGGRPPWGLRNVHS